MSALVVAVPLYVEGGSVEGGSEEGGSLEGGGLEGGGGGRGPGAQVHPETRLVRAAEAPLASAKP